MTDAARDALSDPDAPAHGDGIGGRDAPRRRGRPALGRTTPLDIDDICDKAMQIVVQDGLEKLSMRRLAAELGVTPMAIYHHVPTKPALIDRLIDTIWRTAIPQQDESPDDLLEWMITTLVTTRRVWLEHIELANLSMAVAEPDAAFYANTSLMAEIVKAAGFPNPAQTFWAMQTLTMGSIAVAANRRVSSAYFGRDPEAILQRIRRNLDLTDAPAHHRAVAEARFDGGDEAYYEQTARLLLRALLHAPPADGPEPPTPPST